MLRLKNEMQKKYKIPKTKLWYKCKELVKSNTFEFFSVNNKVHQIHTSELLPVNNKNMQNTQQYLQFTAALD